MCIRDRSNIDQFKRHIGSAFHGIFVTTSGDVYKRQPDARIQRYSVEASSHRHNSELLHTAGNWSVSYTHLDVYKRQVLVAAVSSLFGVRALFTGIRSSRTRGTVSEMLLVSAAMILLLGVIEYMYMRVVKHSSDRYLLTLMQPQRAE